MSTPNQMIAVFTVQRFNPSVQNVYILTFCNRVNESENKAEMKSVAFALFKHKTKRQ